jgi:DNA-binding NarL/FixJ family response regulator
MEHKIRLIHIERNREDAVLFQRRQDGSEVSELAGTYIYHPEILKEAFPEQIDMVAVDTHLPCHMTDFIRELKNKISPAKILLTCEFVQPDLIYNCLRAGAGAYVEKYCSKDRFEQVLKDCSENMIYLPLSILGLLYAKQIIHGADARLKNILGLLSRGFLLNDVIDQTGLSEREIKRSLFLFLHR